MSNRPKMTELHPEFDDIYRFWGKVIIKSVEECWPWIAYINSYGYGRFSLRGTLVQAHRVSYFLHYKVDPGELLVCHKCDVRLCVNPHHLFLGTDADNKIDCMSKNRVPKLEDHGRAKLTNSDVELIKEIYALGSITQAQMAKDFKVDHRSISNIVNNKSWQGL